MNRKLLFVASVACLLGFCLALQAARWQSANSRADKPRLVVDETERDLGAVAAGRIVRAAFSIRNEGSRRLIVREDVCSACNPAEWIIEPGANENLTIDFDVTGLQGSVRQVWHYTTSDPSSPRLTLAVRVTIDPPHVASHP